MTAEKGDKRLFYKLIRRQRKTRGTACSVQFSDPTLDQADGWANYFQELATPLNLAHFNENHKLSIDLQLLLMQDLENNCSTADSIKHSTIRKHVSSLKAGKAADIYGITAEHIQLASPCLIDILTHLINTIFQRGQLPPQLKVGLITPVHKKGKCPKNPDHYRRITVNSVLGKVLEKEMLAQTKNIMKPLQSNLQFGFTEKTSSTHCALAITECIAEAKDNGHMLNIVYMDAKKAFDMVWHGAVLTTIHDDGVTGSLWNLYNSMYTGITSCVKIENELSNTFIEGQGIRQGGLTSTELFKARSNATLKRLASLPSSFRIGTTPVGAPTTADDTALVSSTRIGTQSQINIAESDASHQRYCYSATKTAIQVINSPTNFDYPEYRLNNQPLATSTREKHLGIERTPDTRTTQTIEQRICIGRRTAYSLMGAGLHGLNGVGPKTARKLIDCYILPAMLHGLEALSLSERDCLPLENHYRSLLRQVQHLPCSTASPAVYLLMGSLPVTGLIHIKVLTLFNNIMLQPDSVLATIMKRQISIKSLSSNSWTSHVRNLLHKYSLPSAFHLVQFTPSKDCWRRIVREAVHEFWLEELKDQAATKTTLQHLYTDGCSFHEVHPVWNHSPDPLQVHMASTKAKLLVQRYPLASTHCAGRHRHDVGARLKVKAYYISS